MVGPVLKLLVGLLSYGIIFKCVFIDNNSITIVIYQRLYIIKNIVSVSIRRVYNDYSVIVQNYNI